MITDLSKEIKAILYDRAKSPLFGAFILSWVAWNFFPLISIFSSLTFDQKQFYWYAHYSANNPFLFLFLYPLLSALAFLLIYPYPARWVFRYTKQHHAKLKEIQQRIEDVTPLTQDEANALRKTALETQLSLQKQIRELLDQAKEHRKANEELTETVERLQFQLKQLQLPEAATQPDDTTARKVERPIAEEQETVANTPTVTPSLVTITEDQAKRMTEAFGPQPSMHLIFAAMAKLGGRSDYRQIAEVTQLNPIEVRHYCGQLENMKLIWAFSDNEVNLSPEGERLAIKLGLTSKIT